MTRANWSANATATYAALAVALAPLTESFGRDVWWVWLDRDAEAASLLVGADIVGKSDDLPEKLPRDAGRDRLPGRSRPHTIVTVAGNLLALLLVWFALVAPNQAQRLTPSALFPIPVEGLVVAGLALVLPSWAR